MTAGTAADAPPASPIEAAVLKTLLYADMFDYPLTKSEVHRRLIGVALSRAQLESTLQDSRWLARRVERVNGYYAVNGRGPEVTALRSARAESSERLWRSARLFGRLIAQLPFVRMVAVTGALAVDNADAGDDIDYLIVTTPERVWLARALCIVYVRLARLAGVHLCPNYLLSERALDQPHRDLFTAHELAQMVPLSGRPLVERMRSENDWSAHFLPNAAGREVAFDYTPRGVGRLLQWTGELLLGGRIGLALERWERSRKLRQFAPAVRRPGSAAVLDADRIKGHFDDYGGPAMARFREQLASYGLDLGPGNSLDEGNHA